MKNFKVALDKKSNLDKIFTGQNSQQFLSKLHLMNAHRECTALQKHGQNPRIWSGYTGRHYWAHFSSVQSINDHKTNVTLWPFNSADHYTTIKNFLGTKYNNGLKEDSLTHRYFQSCLCVDTCEACT